MQGEGGMLRRQLGEAEGEVQVLLSQLAVQSKLAVASSKELTQLHDIIRARDNQHRLVLRIPSASSSSCPLLLLVLYFACFARPNYHNNHSAGNWDAALIGCQNWQPIGVHAT